MPTTFSKVIDPIFLLDSCIGTPQKAKETEQHSASKLSTNPLLQFDLKFDSLKVFLDNVATVVNQHATILNGLRVDMNQKIYRDNVILA
jgi:hypothetical protein